MNIDETFEILQNPDATTDDLRSVFLAHKDHLGKGECEACSEYADLGNDTTTYFDWVLTLPGADSELIQEIIDWYEKTGRFLDPRESSAPFGYGQRLTFGFAMQNANCPEIIFSKYADYDWSDYWTSVDFDHHESGIDEIETDVALLETSKTLAESQKVTFRQRAHATGILGCSGDITSCDICSKLLA